MELTPEMIKLYAEKPFQFIERTGLTAITLNKGHVKLLMPLKGNENHIGIMYAGAIFTLAEVPGGVLFLTSFNVTEFYPIIKEVTIRFIRPVKTDITVESFMSDDQINHLEETARQNGKAEYVLNHKLIDEKNELVAESKGIYQIRTNK